MSFIDKFLDVTTPLPREIVRFLKLYKVVEERCKKIETNLKNEREKYLKLIKEKEVKNNNEIITLKNNINKLYQETLTLSDYKQEIIKELKYIFEFSFLKKIAPIIEEGQKECQEQLNSSNTNGNFNSNFFTNTKFTKPTNEDSKNPSEVNDTNKKSEVKLLGNKKYRQKNKRRNPSEYPEEVQSLQDGENAKPVLYCKCKQPSFGEMIESDRCGEWFHYKCVHIEIGKEPQEWFCEDCEKKNKKTDKPKKKKKIHN